MYSPRQFIKRLLTMLTTAWRSAVPDMDRLGGIFLLGLRGGYKLVTAQHRKDVRVRSEKKQNKRTRTRAHAHHAHAHATPRTSHTPHAHTPHKHTHTVPFGRADFIVPVSRSKKLSETILLDQSSGTNVNHCLSRYTNRKLLES